MSNSVDDLASTLATSDDGQSFQDAAESDGDEEIFAHDSDQEDQDGHNEEGKSNDKHGKGTVETPSENGKKQDSIKEDVKAGGLPSDEKDQNAVKNSGSQGKQRAKGKGIAALTARFEQQQKTQDSSPSPQEETHEVESEDEDSAKTEELPPSEGATSLIDPSETIANPFAQGSVAASAHEIAETTPQTPQLDLKRYSHSSQSPGQYKQGEGSAQPPSQQPPPPDTPSTRANRFSTVSLGTSHPDSPSRRKTIVAGGSAATASSAAGSSAHQSTSMDDEATGSSAFLARNTARLSLHEGQRNSTGNNEKLKERLNELRSAHMSRDDGSLRSENEETESTSGTDADENESLHEEETSSNQDDTAMRASWSGSSVAAKAANGAADDEIDWDFWGDVMSNYQEIARTQPRKLSQAIQAGIPAALRGMMWQLMSSSKDEEMEIIYAYYIKQNSPHEKMIRKDLARTFPGQDYFQDGKGIGQENLFNVVKAYSLYDEECGYCQGMQFVVGPLLLNMPDEEAFSTLVRLMKSYDLRGHFVPNMPALQLRLFQFERLLEEFLPLLYRHLVRQGVKSSMYASGWIMTLFTYRSPLSVCFRILDSVFAEGIEALFRFALALMRKNEEQLLTMSFDEAVPLLAARVFDVYKDNALDGQVQDDGHGERTPVAERVMSQGGEGMQGQHRRLSGNDSGYRVSEFVSDAFAFKITPFMLDTYANDFAEQVKAATAHRREIEQLKIDNRGLQIRVKSLEDQLGAVQQEHVDLVKSVVMAKLAKEEMAEELMRYKMMYAEAALLVDQNNVSHHSQPLSPSPSASDGLLSARQSARQSQE